MTTDEDGRKIMTAPKRVLIAGITHESHSFVPGYTSFDRFRIDRDAQILEKADGASSIGGFIEVGNKHGWEIIPSAPTAPTLRRPPITPCSSSSGPSLRSASTGRWR